MTIADLQRLTIDIRNADLRQDTYLALIEQQPQTEAEAQTIVKRARYRLESQYRKRQFQFKNEWREDDIGTDVDADDPLLSQLRAVADALNDDARDLYGRLRQGHTQLDIAVDLCISRQAVNKRHRKLIHSLTK